jgi:biopolymer transport protein ExbB
VITAHGGYSTIAELSHGIYESLLNASAGIAVAIPAYIGHSYLAARVNDIIQDMERAGIEMINLLTDRNTDRSSLVP